MALVNITITLDYPLNNSVQVGDILYFSPSAVVGGVKTVQSFSNIVKLGPIANLSKRATNPKTVIIVQADTLYNAPSAGDFLFFSKDSNVNTSSIAGYYAELKMVNDSTEKAELFSIASEISPRSK